MKKIIQSQIFILLMSFVFVGNAMACSYIYQTPQETYDTNPIVFVGKIKKVTHDGDLNGTRTVTFEILKKYKGDIGSEVTMTTGANSAMCGFEEDSLIVGDIWSIHSQNKDSFLSYPNNIKYVSLAEAQKALDTFADEKPTMCPLNYDPVCGRRDTGIRCVTTPCPSTEDKTYGNTCQLNVDKAEFLYVGECKPDKPVIVIDPPTPSTDTPAEVEATSTTPTDSPENIPKQENIFKKIWNFFVGLFR